jgi:YVTN family beta-propeller protein
MFSAAASAQIIHPKIGTTVKSDDGRITVTLIGKKIAWSSSDPNTYDADIHSPKSVNVHPSGKKFYVNSLEGAKTVAYSMDGFKKLAVINHKFDERADAALWSKPSGLYPFTHYNGRGIALNTFFGKPVESTFSHNGKYLWVPYYRRNYDINAQDPSSVAIIDTETDKIIRLMETGPLPKMIATSPDGRYVAIAHWGNNTVGLIDISSPDPRQWHHKSVLIVDHQLDLHYSLTTPVDRDNGSGYALRGTVFTPDNHYLLVGCMGGGGGIAVIDLQRGEYMGRMLGMMANVRHLVIKNGYLYLSINGGGYVQRIELDKFIDAARQMKNRQGQIAGWTNCKVGTGARTIELSPSGKYIFAACNNASALYVVDAKEMKVITHISVDSYPVGLDISKDGRYIFTTSQGRSGGGGNAVNIFRVDYK